MCEAPSKIPGIERDRSSTRRWGLLAGGRISPDSQRAGQSALPGLLERSWRLDRACVLPRGPSDARVAGVFSVFRARLRHPINLIYALSLLFHIAHA
jgi:hypothetical protein